jgi:hypothetical protein
MKYLQICSRDEVLSVCAQRHEDARSVAQRFFRILVSVLQRLQGHLEEGAAEVDQGKDQRGQEKAGGQSKQGAENEEGRRRIGQYEDTILIPD